MTIFVGCKHPFLYRHRTVVIRSTSCFLEMPFHSVIFFFFLNTHMSSSCILMQVLDRGEKIELLVDKTENLHQQVISLSLSLMHKHMLLIL